MFNVLVYGFYHKGNIGDNLFIDAFKAIFPEYNFVFVNEISASTLKDFSYVFFGGGSFLDKRPDITADAISILLEKNIFYIGVGAETEIHPVHELFIKNAKLVAIRSPESLNKMLKMNANTIVVHDIVYALSRKVNVNKKNNSVLVMPNIYVVPSWYEPHWKHVSWEYFKSEFSQFLDYLIEKNYSVKFLPLCQNADMDDSWAAVEIMNKMHYRNSNLLQQFPSTLDSVLNSISESSAVITQRFHGHILSQMAQTPCMIIHHHDKLKLATNKNNISFYEISKQKLIDSFQETINSDFTNILPIETNIFEELKQKVSSLISSSNSG